MSEDEVFLDRSDEQENDPYTQTRNKQKMSMTMGSFVFFKSCLGISIYINQYYVTNAGLVLGVLAIFTVVVLTGMGVLLMIQIANHLENTGKAKRIENMEQMVYLVSGRKLRILTKILVFLYNQVGMYFTILVILKFLLQHFKDQETVSEGMIIFLTKLGYTIVFMLLILVLKTPESVKYPSMIAFGLFVVMWLSSWLFNLKAYLNTTDKIEIPLFNLSYLGDTLNSVFYSIENIGIVMGLRDTLKEPQKIGKVIVFAFAGVFFIFTFNALTFLFVSLLGVWC